MTTPTSQPARPWPGRLLALAATAALAVTLAHPSSTRQFTWPWLPVLTLAWLAPIIALLADAGRWRSPGRLLTAGLLLLGLGALVSAALSPYAALSLPRLWPTLGGIALFFWVHAWLADRPDRADRLALGLALAGAAVAAVSLVGWRWQSAGGTWLLRNDHPFGHSNYTAGAMLLALPWLAAAAWAARGLRRLAWSLAAIVALLALVTTSSRAGVLALGLAGLGVIGLTLARAPWSRRAKLLLAAVAVAVLVLVVLANPRLRELVAGGGWSETARESNTQRSAMLTAAGHIGAGRPWLGWGPGSVPLVYPLVRGQLDGGVDNVLQLHSTPAQLWATLGVPGLLALLLLVTATVARLGRVVRESDRLAWTAAAALVGYGIFALTDHQLDLPFFNAALALNLALLVRGTGAPVGLAPVTRQSVVLLVCAALLLPLWQTARDLAARFAYDEALAALADGRTDDARARLETAAARHPADPYYRHQLAALLLNRRDTIADPVERDRLAATAAQEFRLSLETGSFQEYAHLNLAWLALESGAPRLAAEHFRAALLQAPHRAGAYFGLGLALRDSGELAAAVRAFALEWVNDPAAATSPAWEHPELALFRPSVERESSAILDELALSRPTAAGVAELWRWWREGGPAPALHATAESETFTASLSAIANGTPLPAAAARQTWGRLLQAWRQTPTDFSAVAPRDPAFAAALARRAARHPAPDVHGFLTAGPEDEANLITAIRSTRTGYGVLALHPDGPVLSDLYVRTAPRIFSTFASGVFPARGWLPARELLSRLPALPPAQP